MLGYAGSVFSRRVFISSGSVEVDGSLIETERFLGLVERGDCEVEPAARDAVGSTAARRRQWPGRDWLWEELYGRCLVSKLCGWDSELTLENMSSLSSPDSLSWTTVIVFTLPSLQSCAVLATSVCSCIDSLLGFISETGWSFLKLSPCNSWEGCPLICVVLLLFLRWHTMAITTITTIRMMTIKLKMAKTTAVTSFSGKKELV